jgi:hypothetical protein
MNIFGVIVIAILVAAFMIKVIHMWYLAWFNPSEFKQDQVVNVKDWWPFARFYRSWFNSSFYLWLTRIMTVIILLIIIFFLSLTILGVLDIFPFNN